MDKKDISEWLKIMERMAVDIGQMKTSHRILNAKIARMESDAQFRDEKWQRDINGIREEIGGVRKEMASMEKKFESQLSDQAVLIENGFMDQAEVLLDGTKSYTDRKVEDHELAFHG